MKTVRGEQVGSAASLMVFCIFAMLAFSVIMLGAVAYRNIAETSREGSDERTCLSYIWTRVKNNDEAESIFVDDFHGVPALFVEEKLNDTVYHTIIYYRDGWIHELFAQAGFEFPLNSGVRIMRVDTLLFEQLESGSILVTAGETSVYIAPRGAVGVES